MDDICSKSYKLPYTYTQKDMCSASSFKFTADKSLAKKGGYCYVESSDLSLVKVYPSDGNDSVLWMDVMDLVNDVQGKKVKVKFTMGNYSKSCYIEIVGLDADWDTVPEEDVARAIVDRSDLADEVVRLINEYRVSKGLNALQYQERFCLKKASVDAGCSILHACRNTCPDTAAALASHGVSMIGWGSTGPCYNPKEVVEDWKNSALHNSNILDPKLKTIACAYFIGGYKYAVTEHVYAYTSVKVSLSRATMEKLNSFSDDLSDECILSDISNDVKSKEELDKYANWFYHPKGDVSFPSKTSTQSVGSDDFSVFSDGSETLTDSFTSGESVESAEPVTSEFEEVGESIEIEDSSESSTDSSEDSNDSIESIESIEIESEE